MAKASLQSLCLLFEVLCRIKRCAIMQVTVGESQRRRAGGKIHGARAGEIARRKVTLQERQVIKDELDR